jgi:hypothetical protein
MAIKTYYIEVSQGYKVIERHTRIKVDEAHALVKELKEKFPAPTYTVTKEHY